MMPMILVTLFLTSFLAGIQWTQLDDTQNNSTGARAGADPAVMDLTNPRTTSVDSTTGEMRNTLKAGDDVNFDMYIKNLGDASIDDLQITVAIKMAEAGVAGNTAVDSSGNELSWTNTDVICNDSETCPFDVLEAGELLDNGKYRMQYGGEDLVWIPEVGDYYVEVSVSTNGINDDIENDLVSKFVSVAHWHDIEIDLAWDQGNDVQTGSGEAGFTLTVKTNGSEEWDARDVAVLVKASGALTSAVGEGSEDLLVSEGVIITAGNSDNLTVFFNSTSFAEGAAEDENASTHDDASMLNPCTPKVVPCNMTSSVVESGSEWSWSGTVLPDTSGSGTEIYEIEAIMISYSSYDQHPECVESAEVQVDGGVNGSTTETWMNECVVTKEQDDDSGTNEASIIGAINNFHDIAVAEINIGQGFVSAGDDARYIRTGGDTLDVGLSTIQALVEHKGSSDTELYDWEVDFTITDSNGVDFTATSDACLSGMQPMYDHKLLGVSGTSDTFGYACTQYNFGPGTHTVSAEITMVGGTHTDQNGGNDELSFEFEVENNAPSIGDLILETTGTLIVGSENPLMLSADAFDADDPDGLELIYNWTRASNGQALPCGGVGPLNSTCEVPIDPTWVPSERITLKVTDDYGEFDAKSIDVDVWNYMEVVESTNSGITVSYTLTYADANDFSYTVADAAEGFQQQELDDTDGPKYVGSYDSVAVVDYEPNLKFNDGEVQDQSLVVSFPSSIAATSLWYTVGNDWELLSDSITTVDSDTNSFVVDLSSVTSGGSLGFGKLAMFGGALEVPDKPVAKATELAMVASKNGDLSLSWDVEGTLVPGDSFKLTVCETNDAATCVEDDMIAQTERGSSVSGDLTTHGTDYTATIQVCNTDTGMCNDFIDTDDAIARSMIDGTFDISDMAISASSGEWTVTWKADGAGSDVTRWKVCYQTADFSANEMNQGTCTVHDSMSATVSQPSKSAGTYTFHFSAAPMDELGNIRFEGALQTTKLVVEEGTTIVDPNDCEKKDADGNCVVGETTKSGGDDVPTWTWFVIIGIVLAAFLVGAFILSRGGEEGGKEGDKDWDY